MKTSTPPAKTALESFRGRVHARLFAGMAGHVQRLGCSRDQISVIQRDRLRALLRHAIRSSPFHARRLADINPARFEPTDLALLPVMTKAAIMTEFDQVVTYRR